MNDMVAKVIKLCKNSRSDVHNAPSAEEMAAAVLKMWTSFVKKP